jgi:hypothetical protein
MFLRCRRPNDRQRISLSNFVDSLDRAADLLNRAVGDHELDFGYPVETAAQYVVEYGLADRLHTRELGFIRRRVLFARHDFETTESGGPISIHFLCMR